MFQLKKNAVRDVKRVRFWIMRKEYAGKPAVVRSYFVMVDNTGEKKKMSQAEMIMNGQKPLSSAIQITAKLIKPWGGEKPPHTYSSL